MNGDYDRFLLSSVTVVGVYIYDIQLFDDEWFLFSGLARDKKN